MRPQEPGDHPNVVLVTVDSLRADHLGCYGYERPTSPNMDALAERAHVFENAWASGPNTPHSLPGLLASRMAFESSSLGLREVPLTLAEMLSAAGYRTQGFVSGNAYLSAYFGYDRGFDELVDFLEFTGPRAPGLRYAQHSERVGSRIPRPLRACHGVLQRAAELVKSTPLLHRLAEATRPAWRPLIEPLWHRGLIRMKQSRAAGFPGPVLRWLEENRVEPFFLWVHSMAVHEPYAPPDECQRAVSGRVLSLRRLAALRLLASDVNHGRRSGMRRRDMEDLIALYDAEVRHADGLIGRIVDVLKRRARWDSTIMIVTADHGEQFLERGRFLHPSAHYNELLRVPLMIRLPRQRQGARIARQAGLVDVMPTVAELVGIEMPPQSCVGASLVPALRDRETDSGPEFYVSESFYGKRGMVYNVDWHRLWQYGRKISFQNRQLKLIVDCSRDTCRAFDLRRDPRETNDLVPARPELARIARGLARLHLRAAERIRIRRRVGRPGPRAGPNETPQ